MSQKSLSTIEGFRLHRPGGENSMTDRLVSQTTSQTLLQDLRLMIEEAGQGVASTVNTVLTMLYRHMGNRINQEILKGVRPGNKPSRADKN